MNNIMQFPEGYRYTSEIELFRAAVDRAEEMLAKEELIIVYQFDSTISVEVLLSQAEYEQNYGEIGWEEFTDILDNEIIYLLRQNFEEPEEKDKGLRSYLKEKDFPEEQQKKIIDLKLEKRRYVEECLGGEREKNRYNLKSRSVLKKFAGIDYELCRTIDEEDILYATIRMSVNTTLEDRNIPKSVRGMFESGREDITFICDKSDVEYLIKKLERIKQML